MWIIRWLLALIVIIVAMWFALDNLQQIVTVKFWKYQIETPLIMSLFVSFIIGALAWFPVAIMQLLHMKSEMRTLRKEKSQLQKELEDLRNRSISEGETQNEDKE